MSLAVTVFINLPDSFSMKKILVMILLCLPFIGISQKRNKAGGRDSAIVVAKREYGNMRYAYAIPFYKRYINTHADDVDAIKELGFCYKIINQYDSAIYFYERAAILGGVTDNVLAELYGNMGMYDKAVKAYDSLLLGENIDTSGYTYKLYKTRQKGFYNHKAYYQDTVDYNLYYLKVNTPLNEFSPSLLDSGFVFESNRGHRVRRNTEFSWDGKQFTQLFFQSSRLNLRTDVIQNTVWSDKKIRRSISDYTSSSPNDNNIFTANFDFKRYKYTDIIKVPFFNNRFKSKGNYGSISFTKDGKEAYFTKNQKIKKGISELEIWSAKRKGKNDWSKFKKLNLNEKGNSIFHPAITDDGSKLYFATDQEGGFGGTDIFYAEKQSDGKWGTPVNAGETINTAGNELFPTFYDGVLYFSSNGHGGLGGLDVYRYLPIENMVENVGAPINSPKDDLGYSRRGEGGYFSSNRYGSDDIYEYTYDPKQIKLFGTTVKNNELKGGLKMKLFNIDKERIADSTITDRSGKYQLNGKPYSRYKLMINDENDSTFQGFEKEILTEKGDADLGEIDVAPVSKKDLKEVNANDFLNEEDNNIISKRKREQNKEKELGEANKYVVYYNLDKSILTKNDKVVLNDLVKQLKQKKELNAVIGSFTDCSADIDYNIKLSNRRSAAVTRYLKDMGIAAGRIIESHYGKNYLVKQCEENQYDIKEQLVNRRSEIYVTDDKKKNWEILYKENVDPATIYSKDIDRPENLSSPRIENRYKNKFDQDQLNKKRVFNEDAERSDNENNNVDLGDTILFVVYFNLDQYDLSNSFGTLSGLKDLMRAFKDYKCIISGHADNEGSAYYDQKLSERRANTVKNYFVSYNIDAARLKIEGYGSKQPAVFGERKLEEGWKNRRAEVRLYR